MIRAITLDLDDTLWPIAPVIVRAEQALHDFLCTHCPEVAAAWPIEAMRELRDRIYLEHPHLAHDFTALRKLSLTQVMTPFGRGDEWVQRAFDTFFDARHDVALYDDAADALAQLSARYPLASVSNGNADLSRLSLMQHFVGQVSARAVGVAKPDARIFQHAAALLGVPANAIAHVGDDPEMDVLGARSAGFYSVWLNRDGAPWPLDEHERPHLEIRTLAELAPALAALPREELCA
jgi:putative hydrolase of the HAD superfamily